MNKIVYVIPKHIKAATHIAQERKLTHAHQKSTLTSQSHMNWHLTTSEESNTSLFILISTVARAASQDYASVVKGTGCKHTTRDDPAKFTGKIQEKKENGIRGAQNWSHPVPGSLHSSPNPTPRPSGFPIPVPPERCLVSRENDHLMVFWFFFFSPGTEQSLAVCVHRPLNKSKWHPVQVTFPETRRQLILGDYWQWTDNAGLRKNGGCQQ